MPLRPDGRSGARPGPTQSLDALFAGLKLAPNEESARLIEQQIRRIWAEQGSGAVRLLMQAGTRNLEAGNHEDAIDDFTAALDLDPTFAEAWHRRAQAFAALGDDDNAIRDIQATLAREPRQFIAMVGLAGLREKRGDLEGAVRSLEAALELYPLLPNAEERLNDLRRRAFGDVT